MLNIIYGRSKTGKTGYIYEKIRENMADAVCGQIVLVPDQYSHEYEVELLSNCGNSFGRYCEVLNFKTLSNRVFESYGKPSGNILDEPERSVLLYKAANSVKSSLVYYGRFIGKADFTDSFLGIIDELKSQNIPFEDIKNALSLIDKNSVLYKKLHDIALIGEAYFAFCAQNALDTSDILTVLAQKLADTDFLKDRTVYIDGFASFSPQEYMTIRQIIKKCDNVYMTLCLSDIFEKAGSFDTEDYFVLQSEPFNIPLQTGLILRKIASEEGIEIKAIKTDSDPQYNSKTIAELEKFLANEPADSTLQSNDGGVKIISCANAVSECEVAAAFIRKTVSDLGFRYNEIALISYDFDSYEKILPEIFRKYDIPISIGSKRGMIENPIPNVLLNSLSTAIYNYPKREFLSYIKSGFTNISDADADTLENYLKVWNISGLQIVKRDDFTFNPAGLGELFTEELKDKLAEINEVRRNAIAPLEKLRKGLQKSKKIGDYIKYLCDFSDEIMLKDKVLAKIQKLMTDGNLELAEEYRQIWEKLVSLLANVNKVLGDCYADEVEFLSILKLMMSKYSIASIPAYLDSVTAGDASRIQVRGVKCTVILGMNDGVIPSKRAERGIFTSVEREKLKDFGLGFIPHGIKDALEQQHSFYNAATSPTYQLLLTYKRVGSDASDSLPSSYISQISSSNLGIAVERDCDIPINDFSWSAEKLIELFPTERKDIYDQDQIRKLIDDSPEINRKFNLAKAANFDSHRKIQDAKTIQEAYGKEITLSASKIDKYNQCRFSYFAEYALKIKPLQKAEFDALKTGIFVHYMLEKIISEVYGKHGGKWDEVLIESLIKTYSAKFLEDEFNSALDESSRIYYLILHQSRIVFKVACAVLKGLESSSFKPVDNELIISDGGAVKPLRFPVDSNHFVKVVGKIDRVDLYKDEKGSYIRIVDYKTGSKNLNLNKVANGLDMQMFVYLFSICENGKERYGSKCVPAGVLYFPAANPIAKGMQSDSEQEIADGVESNLRMSGYVLDDDSLIYAMDNTIDKKSRFIPVEYKNDGQLSSRSCVLNDEEFEVVKKHTYNTISEMGRQLFEGNIDINPYQESNDRTVCDYCPFREICRFDNTNCDSYRYLKQYKGKDGAISAMRGGETLD